MNTVDIMVDTETGGTLPGSSIFSIGACLIAAPAVSFYKTISRESNRFYGLIEDPSAMAWWDSQSSEARNEALAGTTELLIALGEFSDWFRSLDGPKEKKFVWANGGDFDFPILSVAYDRCSMQAPWSYKNVRCYRTLKNLYRDIEPSIFQGVEHNSLADAQNQAIHAAKLLRRHYLRV